MLRRRSETPYQSVDQVRSVANFLEKIDRVKYLCKQLLAQTERLYHHGGRFETFLVLELACYGACLSGYIDWYRPWTTHQH